MGNRSQSVHDFHTSLQKFGWPDYLVFYSMLVVSVLVGVYFAYRDHQKRKNVTESRRGSLVQNYLVGGRKMPVFPVSMSLVASWMSGISLLGTSTEIYLYGCSFMYTILPAYIMAFVTYHVYLPVYHDLKITTIYEVRIKENLFSGVQ
jgi:insulin-like growth factor 2 mRNA-binding protein 1